MEWINEDKSNDRKGLIFNLEKGNVLHFMYMYTRMSVVTGMGH